MIGFDEATAPIVRFRDQRDWAQFHTPKNLAAAIAIEAAELQEVLLWKTDSETAALPAAAHDNIAREIADVLIYALLFCHDMGVDPAAAISSKLAENEIKYPIELAKGNADKYSSR